MLKTTRQFHLASFGEREIYFLSNIFSEGTLVAQKIKSKLVLNKIKYIKPLMFLYPTKENLEDINHLFEVEIRGYFEHLDGEIAGEIHVPKAYIGDSESTLFDLSWEECVIEVIPVEIYQKHHMSDKKQEKAKRASITFYFTENRMIRPFGIIERSFTGEVKSKFKPLVTLDFKNGWIGKLETHYEYINTKIEEIGGYFSSSKLVLNLKKENHSLLSVKEIERISELVDKLLLCISFGTRQKTTWVAWSTRIGTEYIDFCRRIGIPQKIRELEEPLISKDLLQKFTQHCLDVLCCNENLNLYLPLLYLVTADNPRKTVESEFLSLFISLEALLHLYGKKQSKTKHFTPEGWKTIYAHIEKAIGEIQFLKNEDKARMVSKIGIFNQTSINFLYKYFCKVMQIDNSDLWPIFGEGLSLSRIRNKLIHGILSGDETFLSFAKIHLKWIVERSLLAAIGWKNESNVDSEALHQYNPYRDWKQYYGRKEKEVE